MKAIAVKTFKQKSSGNPISLYEEKPAIVRTESSINIRPIEIKRYLWKLRKNRLYNFSEDFVY